MDYEIWPLGDCALLLRFGGGIDSACNAVVQRAATVLAAAQVPGVRAIGPSYAALALTLDLVAVARLGGIDVCEGLIRSALDGSETAAATVPRTVEIATRYGGIDGPDLVAVAATLGLSVDQVVALHSAATYRVAMVGFQPGFPYLLGLPEALKLPRRASPRPRVAAGSVAIAGAQAGIYPGESPGGWHLIGRTDVRLFDPSLSPPAYLLPGDCVRFVALD